MFRWISLAVVGALTLALYLLPPANRSRLAAQQAHSLLAQKVDPAEPDSPKHAALILDGPATTRDGQRVSFRLGGVFVIPPEGEVIDLILHLAARRNVLRGLREQAAASDLELSVEGEQIAAPGGMNFVVRVREDQLALAYDMPGEEATWIEKPWRPPQRTSILPPLIAILMAVLLRRPVISLFVGVWAASALVRSAQGSGALSSLAGGLPDVFSIYFWDELLDRDRQMIIGFVIFMLAMVGVLTKSGGIRGMMDVIAARAKSARGTQIATYFMGLLVFFDDYANTILCGSTMRPLADRFRVAREKLAYIVDSTAAPVAGLSVLSTWIAFEVSTFSAQLPAAGLASSQGYEVFIQSLPYRFYCVLTLGFVAMVVFTGRDFGPMRTAEHRARTTGQLVRPGGKPMVADAATHIEPAPGVTPRAIAGLLPILIFMGVTLFEILRAGGAFELPLAELLTLEGFTGVLGSEDTVLGGLPVFWSLFLGSVCGFGAACLFALKQGLRAEILRAAWTTLRSMGVAVGILYLAWMLGEACKSLGTAPYLTALLGDKLNPAFLPAILFLLSAIVALSTGSSWSTMTILLPLVVALAYDLGQDSGFLGENSGHLLLLMTIGAVLEGAIFGDHCSPISDTTVLSSVACASDHVDHVRTQAPYAVMTMAVALGAGYLPCTFLGWSPWMGMASGLLVLYVLLRWLGTPSPGAPPAGERVAA